MCSFCSFSLFEVVVRLENWANMSVSRRTRLQIKYIFYYSPNIFSTFFTFTLFFFQIRFLYKRKLTFNPTFRWNEEWGIRKDAVEWVQRSNLFELCRAWASSAKPIRSCHAGCKHVRWTAPYSLTRLSVGRAGWRRTLVFITIIRHTMMITVLSLRILISMISWRILTPLTKGSQLPEVEMGSWNGS